jgi:hypothetical protein
MPVRFASSYSDAVSRAPRLLIEIVGALAIASSAPSLWAAPSATEGPATTLAPRRTTTVVVMPDLGTAVENAVPGRAFGLAAAMDAQQRWSEAAVLYQQAAAEWAEALRLHPSPALERALQKAERERQRSQLLASTRPTRGRLESTATSINPLEEGRLLRAKLMVVRATRGQAPAELVTRARAAFGEALRAAGPQRPALEAEARLLLCATDAAAGERGAARLQRAHVTSAERRDLDNVVPLAVCAAALGEDDDALGYLEMYVLRPAPHQAEPYTLRDLYLANDWDRLRGKERFESLFRSLPSP